jgi:predicted DNA-binding transcriptional regulator YafY
MMISKTQRWLDLIAFLVKHRFPVAYDDIMAAVPAYREKWASQRETDRRSVRRMFERDKDELRELGMPLETVTYTIEYGLEEVEGYRLASRDFYLPYLRVLSAGEPSDRARPPRPPVAGEIELRRDELGAAVDALERVAGLSGFAFAREARSALRKVAFDVDVGELGGAPVLYVDRPGAEVVRERVRRLMDAVLRRKTVEFRYHGIYRGEPTDRRVRPYGLLFRQGHWYLIGHDELRDGLRVFRLGRMEAVEVSARSPKAPDYQLPVDFKLDDYARLEAWELGGGEESPLEALVRFQFPASLWAERNRYGELADELSGGATIRRFDVHQVDPFLRWLQTFMGEARVVSPTELRDEQMELAHRTMAVYGEEPRG